MSEGRDKQAEHALEYLRIVTDIELGEKFNDDSKSRSLTKDEIEVKEAALTSLLEYFVRDPDVKPARARGATKPKRKKQKKAKTK